MKSFDFPLNRVLRYKEQVEDNLKSEHAMILKSITDREAEKKRLEKLFAEISRQRDRDAAHSCQAETFLAYENYFRSIAAAERREQRAIDRLREKEESKRREVIHARMETASIEKLKEKKHSEYEKEAQRDEERMVEEFVSNQNSVSRNSQSG